MHVLVLTSDPSLADRLSRALARVEGMDVSVSVGEAGEPWPDGVEACLADATSGDALVRAAMVGAQADTPVPVIAVVSERAEGPAALQRGAVDYLLQSDEAIRPEALERALHTVRLRGQTLRTLRQERAFTDIILDETDLLVVVTDPAGHIVRFSWAAERATGLTLGEVYGRTLAELHQGAGEAQALEERLAGQQSDAFPIRFRQSWTTPAGRRLTIAWSASAISGEEGDLGAVLLTGQNLTELAHLEELLQAERMLWTQVAEGAPLAVLATDLDGLVVLGLGGALPRLGVDPSAVMGQSAEAVLEAPLASAVRNALSGAEADSTAALSGGPFAVRSQPLVRSDGTAAGALLIATALSVA